MKKLMIPFLLMFFVGIVLLNGCDLAQPMNKNQAKQPDPQNDVSPEDAPPIEVPIAEVLPNPLQVDNNQAEGNTVTVKADVGMSGRGNFGHPTGKNPMEIITVPISAMFLTKDRLVLQSITHAMNLYSAEHGRKPASHAEFMEVIIRYNNIRLPDLPPNQEYLYDPRDGELKIRKPR